MEERYIEPLRKLNYANLDDTQEKRLRELEKKFNNEFGTDYYFMTMKREQ